MTEHSFAWHQWVWDPFTRVAGGLGLALGLATVLLQAAWSWQAGLVLDGVLDLHYGQSDLGRQLAMGMINLISLTLPLGLFAMWLAPGRFRWIDLAGTLAMARWPLFLAMAVSLLPPFRAATERVVANPTAVPPGNDAMVLLAGAAVLMLALLAMILLSYRAYSVSCNIRGPKGWLSFAAALVLAELLSKLGALWLMG